MKPSEPDAPVAVSPSVSRMAFPQDAFRFPRTTLGNRFVYSVISARAGGLSIGVNMKPDKQCTYDCVYCEADRSVTPCKNVLDVEYMATELEQTLTNAHSGRLRLQPCYRNAPEELMRLRHVALSGDGEPTLCPVFSDAVLAVMHVRALNRVPFFKVVLITNATGLDRSDVQFGLKFFNSNDEVWAKLDAGSEAHFRKVNRSKVGIERVLRNILLIARQRPVVIQSLFPMINGEEPNLDEIAFYCDRLADLKAKGAQIPLVQIYSALRPCARSGIGHLSLKTLSRIAQAVRSQTGLRAEVF